LFDRFIVSHHKVSGISAKIMTRTSLHIINHVGKKLALGCQYNSVSARLLNLQDNSQFYQNFLRTFF